MSRKSKLVLKAISTDNFEIAKAVNTLDHGVPGDNLTRTQVDRLFIDEKARLNRGELTIEFINGRNQS